MSTQSVSSPRPIDAPVRTVEGFKILRSPVNTPTRGTTVRKAASLLSLELSSPTRCEQSRDWCETDSDEADCSEYSDNEDYEEAGLPICIRDQAHYKLMLCARAVVNSRLYACAHPSQQQVQQ